MPAPQCNLCTRLLIDPVPGPGAWNMAVDEMLLESVISTPRCILRIYQWSEATVSLGYFQDAAVPQADPRLQKLPIVRRLSGGGALLHQHELTYACILPAGHPLTRIPPEIYTAVHERIAALLVYRGFPVRLRGATDLMRRREYLCFGRGDKHDLVLDGFKVLGSAQRRRKGAVLQHGSLLLRKSEHAPQYPGLFDLASPADDIQGLAADLAGEVGRLLGSLTQPEPLSAEEIDEARAISETRYATLDDARHRAI